MARAGPSGTQRSQRAPQPSQSQSQRPVRGSRRVADEDDEGENTGEQDDPDMDINESQRRGDAERSADSSGLDHSLVLSVQVKILTAESYAESLHW